MDESELARRIEVYLSVALPDIADAGRIAEALAPRLYPYVRQPPEPPRPTSATLDALLPSDALLFFGASWDGNTQRYRPIVEEAGRRLNRRVVEIDVDDPVGGAIATVLNVLNTPALRVPESPAVLVGARHLEQVVRHFGGSP